MKKNRVQKIVIHDGIDSDNCLATEKIDGFHADIIERRLKASGLTAQQQTAVIDQIINNIRRGHFLQL